MLPIINEDIAEKVSGSTRKKGQSINACHAMPFVCHHISLLGAHSARLPLPDFFWPFKDLVNFKMFIEGVWVS